MGDNGQPLHNAALFAAAPYASLTSGDKGGNSLTLSPSVPAGGSSATQLHAFWDATAGFLDSIYSAYPSPGGQYDPGVDAAGVQAEAAALDDAFVASVVAAGAPLGQLTDANATLFRQWVVEGAAVAKSLAYAAPVFTAISSGAWQGGDRFAALRRVPFVFGCLMHALARAGSTTVSTSGAAWANYTTYAKAQCKVQLQKARHC